MRMWGAGFGFAAVRAVTRDKKPVSIPFLKWSGIPSAMRRSHGASDRAVTASQHREDELSPAG
jgi:hypothetical protein